MTMSDEEMVEHDLRVERMTVNIEKLRQDIKLDQTRMQYEVWRMILQAAAIIVGAFAAGAAWWNYFGHR